MLVNYLLLLITLLICAGLALDVGMMQWRAIRLQQAADATAQEAMYQYSRNDSNWSAAGQAQATQNGFTNGVNGATVTMTNPPVSGPYSGDSWSVQAKVSQSFNTLLMGFLNNGTASVTATATAKEIPTCVWIMNPTSSSNGSLWLASAGMYAWTCGVFVNTATGYSFGVDGFASLRAARIRVVAGSSSASLTSGTITPQPKYVASVKNDPLAYVTAPSQPVPAACAYSAVSVSGGSHTLNPGIYCGGITFSSTTITLNAGLYVIAGGLTVNNSNIYGTSGVTLYFTKTTSSSSYVNVSINGSNSSLYGIYLKAPTSSSGGAIPGVVVFADRNWVTHGSQGFQLQGVQVTTDGFWYLPNTGLYMWSSPFSYYNYNGLIIDNLYQYGASSNFASSFTPLSGVSPLHYEDGVLVQ